MDKNTEKLAKYIVNHEETEELIKAIAMAEISAQITKARIDRGLNQKEFADLLGVTQGMVSRWESDNYNFTIGTIAKICIKLGISITINMNCAQAI